MANSKVTNITNILLWALLLLGFLGAAKISYENMTGTPCPYIAVVPICYVVFLAYGLMLISVLIRHMGSMHYTFCVGWGVAFLIALVGSIAEIAAGGGVCPTTGGGIRDGSGSIPMCFASLAMLIIILVLFLFGPYKRACDRCNAVAT